MLWWCARGAHSGHETHLYLTRESVSSAHTRSPSSQLKCIEPIKTKEKKKNNIQRKREKKSTGH